MFALSILADHYPEKTDDYEPTWLNRKAERMRSVLRSRIGMNQRRLSRIVELVCDDAGPWWGSLADADRAEALSALKRELRKNGFRDDLTVARALAIVCDIAKTTLGLEPRPPQIKAAFVLLHGHVVELDTGEGKSLVAALAAACGAMAGLHVHVITVNDYLAARDSETFSVFFATLGIRIAAVLEDTDHSERQSRYEHSVVYVSNKSVVFDYLRDRLKRSEGRQGIRRAIESLRGAAQLQPTMRGLQFAIVDEADSVFVDEARTPLVISSSVEDSDSENHCRTAIALARSLEEGVDFELVDGGRAGRITNAGSTRLESLSVALGGFWQGPRLREDLVKQALLALHGFQRDVDYIVSDERVLIVDENTGRVMPDRSWERGLQQLIEIKEGLPPTPPRRNLARLSYQAFFRRYRHLCGMTGTCREVAGELAEVYGLGVVRLAPFRPSRRRRLSTQIFASSNARWAAVVQEIERCRSTGQPVLVGTRSVQASEALSSRLTDMAIPHQVLNAKNHAAEAEIVSTAGGIGAVTIATNMAGRGTDIKLGPGVESLGGLYVILTEGHDNTRVDRQLAGRCARQGDPGCWRAMVCLEDELIRTLPAFWRGITAALMAPIGRVLMQPMAIAVYRFSQYWVSKVQEFERRRLFQSDHQSRRSLSFSGESE
jgi:preprotein translocase subunit SecA